MLSTLCLKQRLWSQTNLVLGLLATATLGFIRLMLVQPHSCFVICLDAWLSPKLPSGLCAEDICVAHMPNTPSQGLTKRNQLYSSGVVASLEPWRSIIVLSLGLVLWGNKSAESV